MFMDALTYWDQGANVHTWSNTPCTDEQTYAQTHIHSLWVTDLIRIHPHTHTHMQEGARTVVDMLPRARVCARPEALQRDGQQS